MFGVAIIYTRRKQMRRPTQTQPRAKTMNRKQLRNAKIDLVSTLQAKMRRFAAGLSTPGVDRAAIEAILEKTRCQIDELEREIAILG